ncbi:MAG: sugar transferase [Candidatus Omnitrophica bacterium]|nr:sugar transferase [Candidatus Omnitrophota bacterium]MDD5429431.1 sugar transferase [Candidatus Omnitrophota bacterium]
MKGILKSARKIYPFYVFTDIAFIVLSFFIAYVFKSNSFIGILTQTFSLPYFKEYLLIFCLWSVIIVAILNTRGLYTTDRGLSIPREVNRVVISIFHASVLTAGVIFFAKYNFFSREVFIKSFFFVCIFLASWRIIKRLILRKLIANGFNNINILIVGAGKIGKIILEEIKRNPHWGFSVAGFLDDCKNGESEGLSILGKLDDFATVAKRYFVDEVIITIPSERKAISGLVKQAKKMRLGLRVVPEDFEEPLPDLDISYLGIIPVITYKRRRHHPAEFILKRIFDFIISLVLLVLLFPLFLIISFLIKITSPGPVLYIQKRSGFKGKIFDFYKFRSMVNDADKIKETLMDRNESRGNVIFKIKNDPRVTGVGKLLRKFSLDELPQIMNVLKGDMSLVGPRPFPVAESQKIGHNHLERFTVRPGITGLAQIRGRSDLPFHRWAKWDLWYVNNWSFGIDFLILWRTLPVVVKGKGAY